MIRLVDILFNISRLQISEAQLVFLAANGTGAELNAEGTPTGLAAELAGTGCREGSVLDNADH